MKDLLLALFGSYSPRVDTVIEKIWNPVTEDFEIVTNFITPPGVAALDWVWLSGVALFGLTLYCVLRIIGGLICGRF